MVVKSLIMGLGLLLTLSTTVGWGQAPGSNKTTVFLQADPPPQVSTVSAFTVGAQGPRTLYYWVVAVYASGNSYPQGPAVVFNANAVMSGGNYVTVTWTPIQGAASYAVLRTTTPSLPSGSASTLVGTTASTVSTINNTSDVLNAYTVASSGIANWYVTLDNKNYPLAIATFASDPITPSYIGTGVPAIPCVVGQRFFQTDAAVPGDNVWWCSATNTWSLPSGGGGGGAPVNATYITQTPDAALTQEQALNALATGLMQVTTATGVVTSVTTSAGVAALISDETGTGALVFATSPTLVTPNIGVATATSVNGLTITSTTGTLTITNAKTATIQNTMTLTATDGSTIAFGTGGTVAYRDAGAITSGNCPIWTVTGTLDPVGIACATGTGDVVGPASAVDSQLTAFDGVTGKLIKAIAGTSGGVYYANAANSVASSAALTANMPVIGGGAGVAPGVGTVSGNTTAFVTTTGAQTSGDCVEIDANGNHIASGAACSAGGVGTVLSGTATIDFASMVDGACTAASTVTVTGAVAATDQPTQVQAPATTSGVWFQSRITAADTVSVWACNLSGAPVDLGSGTYRVGVTRP